MMLTRFDLTRLGLLVAIGSCCWPGLAHGKVLHSKATALKLAFPDANKVTTKHLFLSHRQWAKVSNLWGRKLDTKLFTVYQGYKGDRLLGYAFIDTHIVRTLPETLLIVLTPSGKVRAVHILAFREPPEYMPNQRWLARFKRQTRPQLARGIAGIAGATLSSTAVTRGIRKIIAIYQVALAQTSTAPAKQ